MRHLFLLLITLSTIPAYSQTAGSGTLSSIESKAKAIESLQNQISQMESNLKRWRIERAAFDDILKKRIADKLNEFETSQVWINRRKSAESGWKEHSPGTCGAGGPPPICPVNHWYRVSVSVAMQEYENLKDKELQKIHDQADREKKEFDRKIDDGEKQVAKDYDEIDRLRQQIVQLSKEYKEEVVSDAKSVQGIYISELMRIVANKHYIEDRINIINVKIGDLNNEEAKVIGEAKSKVTKQIDEEKSTLNNKIEANKSRLQQLLTAHQARLEPLHETERMLNQKLIELKAQSNNSSGLSPEEVKKLDNAIADIEARLSATKKSIESYETEYANTKSKIESESKAHSDKVWDLTVNFSKRQQEAIDAVKQAFELRRKILNEAKAARTSSLEQTGALLLSKKAAGRKKFMEYAGKADNERIRLINACSKAGCSCYGIDTHGTIVGNWNKAEGCVGEMESAHHSADPVYGCVEETAAYRQQYASFVNGMSDSDLEAMQRTAGKTRYDLILRKISN